jgi:hypothetical protein
MSVNRAVYIILLVAALTCRSELIWIEGESSSSHNFKTHNGYFGVNKNALSGHNALNSYQSNAEAAYSFTVESHGVYYFWLRANPVAGTKMDYKLNNQACKAVDFSQPIDRINIASDNKPDMRFIAWINCGKVKLNKGKHSVRFRINGGNQKHGYIDCFLFSTARCRTSTSTGPMHC